MGDTFCICKSNVIPVYMNSSEDADHLNSGIGTRMKSLCNYKWCVGEGEPYTFLVYFLNELITLLAGYEMYIGQKSFTYLYL